MTDKSVKVKFSGSDEYSIEIGPGMLNKIADRVRDVSKKPLAFVVTDKKVAPLYLNNVVKRLEAARIKTETEIIAAGEKHKNLNTYLKVVSRFAQTSGAADTVVVALGGGVVGDIAGFAAATYRRGTPVIQCPTTLLACVDSSVGGKTGVDLPFGKNLVGAFHQPRAVLVDTDTLSTLPPREFRTGTAEVIKYGFIMDEPFVKFMEKNIEEFNAGDETLLSRAIECCCRLKAKVVGKDERDTKDIRAILNFGHTFAHALEAVCGYKDYNHGEAVAVGMACASDLSARIGMISQEDAARVERLISAAELPVTIKNAQPRHLLDCMFRDKKCRGGKLRLVLLESKGRAVVADDVDEKDILSVIRSRIARS